MKDFIQLSSILDGLAILGLPDPCRESPEFWKDLDPLVRAVREHDWESIAAAANLLMKRDPHEQLKFEAKNMAFMLFESPEEFGVEKLTKADVIEIMRAKFPLHYATIPTKKRSLSTWWSEVKQDAEQAHGYTPPALRKYLNTCEPATYGHGPSGHYWIGSGNMNCPDDNDPPRP
jgi:hypothetical protein